MQEAETTVSDTRAKFNELPDAEYLHECFNYDLETGVLTWKKRPLSHFPNELTMKKWNTRRSGTVAGGANEWGYTVVGMQQQCGQQVMAHRLIWIMLLGSIPEGVQIDHIDGNPANNRLKNLRLATNRENSLNSRRKTGKRLGKYLRGTYPSLSKWAAGMTVHGKRVYLGTFNTELEAHKAYLRAYRATAGEFAKEEVTG